MRTQLLLMRCRLGLSSHVFHAIVDFPLQLPWATFVVLLLRHPGNSASILESRGSSGCGHHPGATASFSHHMPMKARGPDLIFYNERCPATSYHRSRKHKLLFSL